MNRKERFLYPILGPILKGILWPLGRLRLPKVKGNLTLPGLQESVEILRDKWDVPHIFAHNSTDLFFAQGFVHAQERLWQMDFSRRVIFGRLSEVLGANALSADRTMRTLGLYISAEQEANLVSGDLKTILDAYCHGVNAWINRAILHHMLPLEFLLLGYKPGEWRMADSLAWGKLMSWTLAVNWESELYRQQLVQRLGAEKVKELEIDFEKAWAVIFDLGQAIGGGGTAGSGKEFTGPHAGAGVGSNNWVIGGERTVTGKPLLANDMHLQLTAPGIWYENHLIGGGFDVTGVTLPGVPMVIAGHNRGVAWGYTDGCSDVQDLYEEHLRESQNGEWEYEFEGEWLPAIVRKEVIHIKGGKSEVEKVIVTRHGPIINTLFNNFLPDVPPLALRWTALDPGETFQALFDFNLAQDCHIFKEALRHFDDPSQNIVYADTLGNIAYSLNGRIPIRAKGDGSVPAPGWTGEYEWKGYIPFDEMPHMLNPSKGYIATANNPVNGPDFPYFLGKDFIISDRAGRIVEMVEYRPKIDVGYIKEMQYDQVSLSARTFAHALGSVHVTDPFLGEIVRLMQSWDARLDVESPLACIFEATIRQAIRLVLAHILGELGLDLQGRGVFIGQWPDHVWEWFVRLLEKPESPWYDLGNNENRDDILRLALQKAVDFLREKLGENWEKWKWGKIHHLTFHHILANQKPLDFVFNIGPFPIGGDATTVWAAHISMSDFGRGSMVGPPFRFIADLSDLEHCWGMLAPGQSGHAYSRFYRDGVQNWFSRGYHPMLINRDELQKNLRATLLLRPAS